MKHFVPTAAIACALAVSAAAAADLSPMDVMGPYDTPSAAADRITLPEQSSDAGQQHSEVPIERANSAPDGAFALNPGRLADWLGRPDGDDDDRPGGHGGTDWPGVDKPEKPEADDGGDG